MIKGRQVAAFDVIGPLSFSAVRSCWLVTLDRSEFCWHRMLMATYQETLRVIQPIIMPIFRALRTGLEGAASLHERDRLTRTRDPWFWAHAARRKAADELKASGLLVESERGERPLLPMSGLLVRYRTVAIRIYKTSLAPSGQVIVPVPGRSRVKQSFWRQDPTLDGMEQDNLLVLWRDDAGTLVDPLTLVRPIGGSHRRDSLQLDWVGPLSEHMASLRAADLDELCPTTEQPRLGDEGVG